MDESAAAQLASWYVTLPIRVEWIPIQDDDYFYRLWTSGIFERINGACWSNIDDYEEESLEASQLPAALKAIADLDLRLASEEVKLFADHLQAMMQEAIRLEQSIYFIL